MILQGWKSSLFSPIKKNSSRAYYLRVDDPHDPGLATTLVECQPKVPLRSGSPSYLRVPVVLVLSSLSKGDYPLCGFEFFEDKVRVLGQWPSDSVIPDVKNVFSPPLLYEKYTSYGLHFIFAPTVLKLKSSWKVSHVLISPTLEDFVFSGSTSLLLRTPMPAKPYSRKVAIGNSSCYEIDYYSLCCED